MFPFLMSWEEGKKNVQVETGTEWHFDIAGSEVIIYSFLKYFWLNGTTLLPGGFGSIWNDIFKFLLFFLDPFLLSLSLATFTAASHFTALSLWDYTTKISLSLCRTNCCHDNGRGAVCEWEHKCDCVSNCKSRSNVYMLCVCVCVQYGHVSSLFFLSFWRVSLCPCLELCASFGV